MDRLDLTDEFLQDAQKAMSWDPDIPLPYRILGKLNLEGDFDRAKRFIKANKALFHDEYSYLILDRAVESCLDLVADEDGAVYDVSDTLPKEHLYKPAPIVMEYMEYLLQNGADPHLPKQFDQYEHLKDVEEDCSQQMGVKFDLTDVKKLFDRWGGSIRKQSRKF